jgi:DNA replication protein DnaC
VVLRGQWIIATVITIRRQRFRFTQLKALKLDGMARAFEEQSTLTASTSLSFEERVGMLVDRELAWRDTRRLERLLRAAKLKNPQACVEDIEYRQSRGLDQRIVATLAGCDWVRNAQNLILTGPTERAT